MKQQNRLFRLVKSMSTPEKRYFKRFASQHVAAARNNSIKLFDAVDAQEEYNEKLIRKRFASERFARQLAVQKNYLHGLILRSLRAYHAGNSVGVRISEMLHEIEVLADHRLYDQCLDTITRAQRLAAQHEEFALGLQVQSWRARIAYAISDFQGHADAVREQRNLLDQLADHADYARLAPELNAVVHQYGRTAHPEVMATAQRMLAMDVLNNEQRARSQRSRIMLHGMRCACFEILGKWEQSVQSARQCIALMNTFGDASAEMVSRRIFCLVAQIRVALASGHYHEVPALIEAANALRCPSPDLRIHINRITHQFTLTMHVRAGAFGAALQAAPAVEAIVGGAAPEINHAMRLAMHRDLAHVYFACGEFGRALTHINCIMHDSAEGARADAQLAARVLATIVHLELRNTDTVVSMVNATRRFLRNNNIGTHAIGAVLTLLRRLANTAAPTDARQELERFARTANRQGIDLRTLQPFAIIDVDAWVSSKSMRQAYSVAFTATHAAPQAMQRR